MGRYFWGVGKSPMTFPRTFTIVDFGGVNELSVFDKKGLEVVLYSSFQYRLIPEQIPDLYKRYGLGYPDQIINNARALLKNNVSEQYDVEDYFKNRKQLTKNLNTILREGLLREHVDVPVGKFQLRDVVLPARTRQRFEEIAVLAQHNEKKEFERTSAEVRANTTLQLVNIQANTTKLVRTAEAEAEAIQKAAEAEAFRLRQEAIAQGYKAIFDKLNIVDGKQKMELIKLMSVHKGTRYIVGADNDLLINLS